MAFGVRNVVVDARWNMLHPRDSKGRFTRSFTRVLKPQDNRLARKIIAAFSPRSLVKGAARSVFFAAFGGGDGGGSQQTQQAFQSGALKAAHRAVRTEKAAVNSPIVRAIDAELRPLPHDIEVHRRVEQARFGAVPPEELEGYKVRDAGWAFVTLDPDDNPSGIHMRIRVPAGVRGVVIDEERGLLALDRELEMAITSVEPNGRGGWTMDMVVLHRAKRGDGGGEDADQQRAESAAGGAVDGDQAGDTVTPADATPGSDDEAQPELPLEPTPAVSPSEQDEEPAGGTQPAAPSTSRAPVAEPVMPRPVTPDERRRFVDEPELVAFRQPLTQAGDGREYRASEDTWIRIERDGDDFIVSERGVWGQTYPDTRARYATEDEARAEVEWRMAAATGAPEPDGTRPTPLPDEPAEPTAEERIAEMRTLAGGELAGYVQALKGARLTAVARALGVNRGRVADKRAAIVDALGGQRDEAAGSELGAWWDDDEEPAADVGSPAVDAAGGDQRQPEALPQADVVPTDGPGISERLRSGVADTRPLTGGEAAESVDLLTLGDGSQVVRKRVADLDLGLWANGDSVLGAQDQADAEELASRVAAAMGVRAPEVHRAGEDEIVMEYMPGIPASEQLTTEQVLRGGFGTRYATSDDGALLGLYDLIVANDDRNLGNWLVDADDRISAIDHGMTWHFMGDPTAVSVAQMSAFNEVYVADGSVWRNDIWSPDAMAEFRSRLEELRPQFARLGRAEWLDQSLTRLDALAAVARGARPAPEPQHRPSTAGDMPPVDPLEQVRSDARRTPTPAGHRENLAAVTSRAEAEAYIGALDTDQVDGLLAALGASPGDGTLEGKRRAAVEAAVGRRFPTDSPPPAVDGEPGPEQLPSWLDGDDEDDQPAAAPAASPVDQVHAAYAAELATRADQSYGQWVSLTKLRVHMDQMGMSREEQDTAIRAAARNDGVHLVPENNQKALTDADRAAALRHGGQDKHLISFVQVVSPGLRERAEAASGDLSGFSDSELAILQQDASIPGRLYQQIRAEISQREIGNRPGTPDSPVPVTGEHDPVVPSWLDGDDDEPDGSVTPSASAAPYHLDLTGLADLAEAVENPAKHRDRRRLTGGASADTELVTLADGQRVVHKQGGNPDAELAASLIAQAVGVRAPRVYRNHPSEVWMDYIANAETGAEMWAARGGQNIPKVGASDDGQLVGLLDMMIANSDRNNGNWMVDQTGRLYAIDHGHAFPSQVYPPDGRRILVRPLSWGPFAANYVGGPNNEWVDNRLTPADVAVIRERLTALRPYFDHMGRLRWLEYAIAVLDAVEPYAKGSRDLASGR